MSELFHSPAELKRIAAAAALTAVPANCRLGLGSGSTAEIFVEELAVRVRQGLQVRCCSTSERTARLARSLGIEVAGLDAFEGLDLTVDGADEIDPQLNLIKGGGACHLREKVVAAFSAKLIVIADDSKLVDRLGAFRIPLEVIPFALPLVLREVTGLPGCRSCVQRRSESAPVLTDEGNLVLDADFGLLTDPGSLARLLSDVPGIVEHGLFVDMAESAFIGTQDGVRILGNS
ncbi:MAG: ribose-5-phosphate isomerase RpiA [bacterium]